MYNPNIPMPNDKIRNSQNDLLLNFQALDTAFNFNHVDLEIAGAGKHKLLTMPRQTFPQTVTGTDLLFYVGLNPDTALSELYFKRSTFISDGVPITAGVVAGTTGWTYLPSGALITWGQITANAGTSPFTVTVSGPGYVAAGSYTIQITAQSGDGGSFYATQTNGTQFDLTTDIVAATVFAYMTIGG